MNQTVEYETDPIKMSDRMKTEILADIAKGIVPSTVASFSELHDYVDANGYGGLFDGPLPSEMEEEDGDIYDACTNRAQDIVNAWLKAGRPAAA